MSVVKPPVISEIFGRSGLCEFECKALHEAAYRLMVDGRALGVVQDEDEDGIKCVYVLDIHGNRYTVVRNAGTCLLPQTPRYLQAEPRCRARRMVSRRAHGNRH